MKAEEILALMPEGWIIFKSNSVYYCYSDWRAYEDGAQLSNGPTMLVALTKALEPLGLLEKMATGNHA